MKTSSFLANSRSVLYPCSQDNSFIENFLLFMLLVLGSFRELNKSGFVCVNLDYHRAPSFNENLKSGKCSCLFKADKYIVFSINIFYLSYDKFLGQLTPFIKLCNNSTNQHKKRESVKDLMIEQIIWFNCVKKFVLT